MKWVGAYKAVTKYIVRIKTQSGTGTGFFFVRNNTDSFAGIATAWHVVEEAHDWKQPIRIQHYATGEEVYLEERDRIIFPDRERDSASILISPKALNLPKEPPNLADPSKFLPPGCEFGWVGFPAVAPADLCFFHGHVSAWLNRSDCYLVDGVAINGVSGGPVFDPLGEDSFTIYATISAYLPNRGGATPGLLKAQDIVPFANTVKQLKSWDEARAREEAEAKKAGAESPEPDKEPRG